MDSRRRPPKTISPTIKARARPEASNKPSCDSDQQLHATAEALALSQARFRALSELSADWYWEQDAQFRFTYFSGMLEQKTGQAFKALLGTQRWDTLRDNLTPEDWARHKAQLERHEAFYDFEMCRKKSDGTEVWTLISGVPIFDESGRFTGYRGIGRDITAKKAAEQALRTSEARFRDLTELSADWYWETDADFRLSSVHTGARMLQHFQPSEGIGKLPWELPNTDVPADVWQAHKADLAARRPFHDLVLKHRLDNGGFRILSISGKPLFDANGVFCGYRGVGKDITERKVSEDRIQYIATHDHLTGLPNRAMFAEILRLAIESGRRYNRSFAIFFIDIDRFKYINDSLGHEAGDELLKEIGKRLSENLRASDAVARSGGDEFAVLVQEVKEHDHLSRVAQKVLNALVAPIIVRGQECRVTASIGIAIYPSDAQDEHALIKSADIAMYRAKDAGRNSFQFYSPELSVRSQERMMLETSLRQAVEREEFSLHYQAKLNLKTGRITGVEALLRWQHPMLGMIPPAQFIPVAEDTGLIIPIGKWVLQAACRQNMLWQRRGLPGLCMAVNLSPRQFSDGQLINHVAAVLEETRMPADLLELELTEGMVMQDPDRAINTLAAIKAMGVRIAIDDFGVGYSSLAQIRRFPIDTLKIDRSFIREIPNAPEDNAIAEVIIAMGKTLHLNVIAEGVETAEQKQFLREHDCDEMQGYFFSRPVAADQCTAFLEQHRPGIKQ